MIAPREITKYSSTWRNPYIDSRCGGITHTANPSFYYWQVGGSWFLTGENRRYNKQTGTLGKLIPKKNLNFKRGGGFGAVELGARYTESNLVNGKIDGGKFGRFTSALGWYPDAHFRFEINYGIGNLDRMDLSGKADFWQFRAQFEF